MTSNYTRWHGFVRADPSAVLDAYGVYLGRSGNACEFAINPSPS